jgi:copper homeostasis protein
MIIESCCASVESVRRAVQRGAKRIELCRDLKVGGLTPSEEQIREALDIAGDTPINVLVRPRDGDFVYSEEEIVSMLESIKLCKQIGVNGVVIGALTPEGKIDIKTVRRLMEEACPLHVTFHRAFDECDNISVALEDIIDLGIERLLTSGHHATAYEGRFTLKSLVEQAAGRIVIMPGCGITPSNLEEIEKETGAVEFHGSRLP